MTWDRGGKYEGEFFKDKMHGKGKMIEADGISYEGQWENGKR